MTRDQYAVIIVYSISHALRIEKLLQEIEIPCKLIPVPRHISSDCGVCVRVVQSDVDAARNGIEAASLEIEGIHQI